MKKLNKILTTALACGLLGGSFAIAGLVSGKEVKKAEATDELEYSIEMTSAFFENWNNPDGDFVYPEGKTGSDLVPGKFKGADGKDYDKRPLNAMGSVFDGCQDSYEHFIGTLKSRKWRQTTPWIYFTWGCANNNDDGGPSKEVKLVFKLWASASATTPYKTYDYYNNTFSKCTMVLRNFHVSTTDYEALGGDFYMSVDLVDGRTGNYGAHEFGYLHVNQTHQQVSDAEWYYYTHCVDGETDVATLRSHYYLNDNLRDGFVTGFSESFETQDSFNTNWMKDGYGNNIGDDGAENGARHADKAISTSTYRTGTNMPFNKTGDGFFKGWYGGADQDGGDNDRGYVHTDDAVYRFVSRPFRLPDNGIVSIKMAGNSASLHLIDFDGGHSDLAFVDRKVFSSGESNNIAEGGQNVCTMVRHVVNFSHYAGRLVQIGIADVDNKAGGWNAVYFDELKADYASLPSLKIDVVEQNKDGKSYSAIRDVYVTSVEADGGVDYANNDGPASDTCALKPAAAFVNSYLDLFRRHRVETKDGDNVIISYNEEDSYCSLYKTTSATALLTTYNGLSGAAQAIVRASDDYHRVGATVSNWSTVKPTFDLKAGSEAVQNLGYSVDYLAAANDVSLLSNSRVLGSFESNNIALIIIVSASVAIAVLGFALFRRKKNQK